MQRVVDPDGSAGLQGTHLQAFGADWSAGHGQDRIDADGAQQRALSRHVRAAHQPDAGVAGKIHIVANPRRRWDQRVP